MAKKKKPKKLTQAQLLESIVEATMDGKALYEFLPGARKLDFLDMYCQRWIKPGGTNKQGWVSTPAGEKQAGYF